jgi:hypothetical protein
MALQAFTLYPVFCLGPLDLKVYVKHSGLVWAQCNPEAVMDKHIFFNDLGQEAEANFEAELITVAQSTLQYLKVAAGQIKHGFTQIGNASRIVVASTGFDNPATIGYATLTCQKMTITRCNSTIMGFRILDSSKGKITQFFSTTRYFPSQKLDYYAFPHNPNQNGINSSLNAPLVNCSFISFMFPRNPNDVTVFENIMYQNVQVTIKNKNYPDEGITTVGARFLQLQLVASELDGSVEPTAEYERSLTEEKNQGQARNYARKRNMTADASSFMLNIQLERSGAGYCFDGLDSGGQNVSIQLKGDPLVKGANDTYFNFQTGIETVTVTPAVWDNTGSDPVLVTPAVTREDIITANPVAPEAWICRECYWEIDTNKGLRFISDGVPPGSQTQF